MEDTNGFGGFSAVSDFWAFEVAIPYIQGKSKRCDFAEILRKLKLVLNSVTAVLDDAEQKQIHNYLLKSQRNQTQIMKLTPKSDSPRSIMQKPSPLEIENHLQREGDRGRRGRERERDGEG